jgi:hypothetical protein
MVKKYIEIVNVVVFVDSIVRNETFAPGYINSAPVLYRAIVKIYNKMY